MLDLGPAHRLGDLGVGRRQGGGDLTLQMADRAQGHGGAEDHLGDLLDGPLAQVAAAGQKGQGGRQAWADARGPDLGGDGGVGDLAAAGAGAGLALVLGDLHGPGRQLGDLMPGRFGVVGAGRGGQRGLTAAAVRRRQDVGRVDAVGRQALPQGGGDDRAGRRAVGRSAS